MNKLYTILFLFIFISCKSNYNYNNTSSSTTKATSSTTKATSSTTKSIKNKSINKPIRAYYRAYCKTEKKYLNRSWNSDKQVARNDISYHKRKNPKHKVKIARK